MKHIKNFISYNESNTLNKSFGVWNKMLLDSISAEEMDIFKTFNLPIGEYKNIMDIDFLSSYAPFINSLISIGLRLSNIYNTDDYETFLKKSCKFAFIYNIGSSDLENPLFIIIQIWDNTSDKWGVCKLYRVNEEIGKFYDILSSKTIELECGKNKRVYYTSNGNEWNLKKGKENSEFKKYLRTDDLKKLIGDKKLTVNIIK